MLLKNVLQISTRVGHNQLQLCKTQKTDVNEETEIQFVYLKSNLLYLFSTFINNILKTDIQFIRTQNCHIYQCFYQ